MQTQDDKALMKRALRLARKGGPAVGANPRVGAVYVRDGKVLGEGYHRRFGGPHAELEAARGLPPGALEGATLYVTLEPCAHTGKTPPCADFLVRSGVRRVVVGAIDPNPLVRGAGIQRLRRAGLRVAVGVEAAACGRLLREHRLRVKTGTPHVLLKLAQTLDGRLATRTGDSRWVSSAASRRYVHRLRAGSDAVLVGARTARRDDPRLDARDAKSARQPYRVIVDGRLRLDPDARIFKTPGGPVILATTRLARAAVRRRFEDRARVLVLPGVRGRVDLRALLAALRQLGCWRILVEGGGELAAELLSKNLLSELCLFVAPKIAGGLNAVPAFGGRGIARMCAARRLKSWSCRRLGGDLLIRGKF